MTPFQPILYAGYGIGQQSTGQQSPIVDVTSQVRAAYAAGTRLFLASNTWVTQDPAPGKVKCLYIVWLQGGQVASGVAFEHTTQGISLALAGMTEFTDVTITTATYGYGVSYDPRDKPPVLDVTSQVAAALSSGQHLFLANNNWAGDPASGKTKYLSVVWSQSGFTSLGVIGENDPTGIAIPGCGPWGAQIYQAIGCQAIGYSFAVYQKGALVEQGGAGWARAPWEASNPSVSVVPNQLITIGSASKPITATALLLQLQGLQNVTVDTPICSIQQFSQQLYQRKITTGTGVGGITLKNLLTHSSALNGVGPYDWSDVDELWEMVDAFLSQRVNDAKGPPGNTYEYLNENYGVLRAIISSIGGTSYETYVTQNLFTPMGITLTNITGDCDTLYYSSAQISGPGWNIPDQASWRSNGTEMGTFLQILRGAPTLDNQASLLNQASLDVMFTTNTIPNSWNGTESVEDPKNVQLGFYPGQVNAGSNSVSYSQHNGAYGEAGRQGSMAGIVRFQDTLQTDVALLINTRVDNSLQPVVIIPQIYAQLASTP